MSQHRSADYDALRRAVERLADTFQSQDYAEWTGEERGPQAGHSRRWR